MHFIEVYFYGVTHVSNEIIRIAFGTIYIKTTEFYPNVVVSPLITKLKLWKIQVEYELHSRMKVQVEVERTCKNNYQKYFNESMNHYCTNLMQHSKNKQIFPAASSPYRTGF